MNKPKNEVHNFICTHRMHRRVVDKVVANSGIELHRSQHMLLVHLKRRSDCFSQRELAEHLGISPAALAVKIKKLESDGLVVRQRSKADSRTNAVRITEKGSEILDKAHKLFEGIDQRMIKGIEAKELGIFVQCLEKMQKNLQEIYNDPNIVKEKTL